ncbi:PREDICTED: cilia- and flagella-associated protein 100 [Crocodylus porosus]|uniref:Cilia and flagella associated protein 100 n=1 Tax=Crocodylus porosus TaxID=8502 RepID=A0A7M4FLD4_CROPO|nr:PREDICTED: cilia- and flagella-associated protein 100 [Crocodylus porosus]
MSALSHTRSILSQETCSSGAIPRSRTISQQTAAQSPKSGMEATCTPSVCTDEDESQMMKNPFKIPSDTDIFLLRDKEREKAKKERQRKKTMKIHEKMTYSSMMNVKQSEFKKQLQKEEEEEDRELAAETERMRALQETLSWKIAVTKDQQVEKESLHEYINQKREMFRMQYAIAVKRDEIQKLENLAAEEEAKLEKAEQYLEKDAAMFDDFLKENDKNSAQALKIAERETKAKMDKIIEIRELTAQMMNIQSEISRLEDTLQEYRMYRDFLYQLSPKEWQEEHEKKQMKKREMKMASRAKEENTSTLPPVPKGRELTSQSKQGRFPTTGSAGRLSVDFSAEELEFRPLSQSQRKESIKQGKMPSKQNPKPLSARRVSETASLKMEKADPVCSDDEDEDEAPELYFTDPKQLLNIFTELEEQNLSLIQNSRETEETLDELKHALTTTQNKMGREIAQLEQLEVTLKASIAKEEETAKDLAIKAQVFSFGEFKSEFQEKMLASLSKKVLEVYRHCIGENDSNLGTLQMLTVIEHQLDDLLECLERVPPAKIEQAEKTKEKERRMRLRDEKIKQQRQLQEERIQRALARAQADIKKKTGRRLVFRSEPPPIKEKEDENQGLIDQEKEEALYYFT